MLRLLVAIQLAVSDARGAGPYPSSKSVISGIHAVAEIGRSQAELLCLDTLAGNLARETPRLYRVSAKGWRSHLDDGYHLWLDDLETAHGVIVDDSLAESPLQAIVANFQNEVAGYVRCGAKDASTSAAITFAAAGEGLLVAADDATAAALEAAGVPMARDLRGKGVGDVLAEVLPRLSDQIFVFQDPSKMDHLGDYAVFARAAFLAFGSDSPSQATLLARARGPAAAFGWGPENDFVRTVNEHGVYVHASDWNKNLAALGNTPGGAAVKAAATSPAANATSDSLHTVAFVMTDGDNLQWTLGNWAVDQKWFGSPSRGNVPMGWTFSPGAASVGPSAVLKILESMTGNDELVAGPSGVGYMFPSAWPASGRADFAALTFSGMRRSGMRIVNALGADDELPADDTLSSLLDSDSVDAMFYYGWGDGYASIHGKAWQVGGKPVISSRYSLWGEGSGNMCGVKPMIEKLKAMPKDPSSSEGYSVIPVHAWSHGYDDVLAVAQGLAEAGGIDVVLPSELVRRYKEKVGPRRITCHCDSPGRASPHNGYTCSDVSRNAYCSSTQSCAASDEWAFPDGGGWSGICQESAILA